MLARGCIERPARQLRGTGSVQGVVRSAIVCTGEEALIGAAEVREGRAAAERGPTRAKLFFCFCCKEAEVRQRRSVPSQTSAAWVREAGKAGRRAMAQENIGSACSHREKE